MKLYYVIKDLRDNLYFSIFSNQFSEDIGSAMEFESEQEAVEYAERNFDYYFTFTIEKVYQITKY